MGKRGPKPTPKETLKLRGSWRAKLNPEEPQFPVEAPQCPAHLKGDARNEWNRIVPKLRDKGILALVDRATLAAYCMAWARWVKAEKQVEEFGEVIESDAGNFYQNPWLAVANKAMEQMTKLAAEFGMSPSSRTRVVAPKQPESKPRVASRHRA